MVRGYHRQTADCRRLPTVTTPKSLGRDRMLELMKDTFESELKRSPCDWHEETARWRQVINLTLEHYTNLELESPPLLTEAIRYSLLGPGKRLRPLLVLAACQMCGGHPYAALPAAAAVEMIHAYSLVHDDLPGMDDDSLRRGRPTCHIQFNHATAILVGDSLQSLAFQVLGDATHESQVISLGSAISAGSEISIDSVNIPPFSAEVAAKCVATLAKASGACGMAGGQQDDLTADSLPVTEESLERIHRRKTGALLAASLQMGGIVAGASAGELANLSRLGQDIGLAFQIVDDLLDVVGDADQVGKQTGKDKDRGKMTYPSLFGVDGSRQKAESLIDRATAYLDAYGSRANVLRGIARFVLERQQ